MGRRGGREGASKKLLILSALYYGDVKEGAGRWERACEVCLGEGCEECEGHGWIKETGKPTERLTLEGHDLWQAYLWLREYRAMPVAGGWLDQTAAFVDAVNYCDKTHAAYCRRKDEKNRIAEEMDKRLKDRPRRNKK